MHLPGKVYGTAYTGVVLHHLSVARTYGGNDVQHRVKKRKETSGVLLRNTCMRYCTHNTVTYVTV